MEVNTGIHEQGRQEISEELMKFLADTYALYLKTQNFHWNLTGVEFNSIHKMFEKQYEELAEAVDEIAERIRALGFFVEASFSAFKKLSQLKDEDHVLSIHEMLQQLLYGHEHVVRKARHITGISDKEQDFATSDLMARRLGIHEKFAWMLRSSI